MTTIEAYESGRRAEIPSSWDEMTPAQVQMVFRQNAICLEQGLSPLDFNVRVLYGLLGIRPGFKVSLFPGRRAENVYRLCEECLGFLFVPGTTQLSFDSIRNPLPRVGKLIGPDDLLQNLTFGEFRHAVIAHQAFLRDREMEDLHEFIATLYRSPDGPVNRAGRRTGPLGGKAFRKDVKAAASMHYWQQSLILMWFSACLKYLQTGKLFLNGEEVDLSLLFREDGAGKGPKSTWNDLLVQIAKDQTIGNIDRVDEEPLFSIFSLMWSNYKEVKRYEALSKTGKH